MPRTKVGRQLLAWEESIDDEVRFRLAREQEELAEGRISKSECKTEKEIEHEIYGDQDFWDLRWADLKDALTEILQQKNRAVYWQARVRNFGWRSLDGSKYLQADRGLEFLREILPNADCHFRIFDYGRGLAIQNFHHDSPVGNEWYYVLPTTPRRFEEFG
jgi:hypothetical protein